MYFAAPVASDVGLFQWIVEKVRGIMYLGSTCGATKADCLSHQILFAKVGESLSVFRRHYGATASVIPYMLMAHQHLEVVAGQRVCVFSDRTMTYQQQP